MPLFRCQGTVATPVASLFLFIHFILSFLPHFFSFFMMATSHFRNVEWLADDVLICVATSGILCCLFSFPFSFLDIAVTSVWMQCFQGVTNFLIGLNMLKM